MSDNRLSGSNVWGFIATDKVQNFRDLSVPPVLRNMYSISSKGDIWHKLDESLVKWNFDRNGPYVKLLTNDFTFKPFYVKYLVACTYVERSTEYLERGFKILNIDGNPKNCDSSNLILIDPSTEF